MRSIAQFVYNLDSGVDTNPDIEQGLLPLACGNDRNYSVYGASIRNDFSDYFDSDEGKVVCQYTEIIRGGK